MLVAVHAEIDHPEYARGTTVRDYLASRPISMELEAIRLALDLAGETRLRAARRPRQQRGRRAAHRGGRARRGGRDLRDVPALSRPDRRGRGAPRRAGQVRAAAAKRPASAARCSTACARGLVDTIGSTILPRRRR